MSRHDASILAALPAGTAITGIVFQGEFQTWTLEDDGRWFGVYYINGARCFAGRRDHADMASALHRNPDAAIVADFGTVR